MEWIWKLISWKVIYVYLTSKRFALAKESSKQECYPKFLKKSFVVSFILRQFLCRLSLNPPASLPSETWLSSDPRSSRRWLVWLRTPTPASQSFQSKHMSADHLHLQTGCCIPRACGRRTWLCWTSAPWRRGRSGTTLRTLWISAVDLKLPSSFRHGGLLHWNMQLDNSKLGSTQQQKICWHRHVARIISSQKIYGLYARKHHIVEMRWDVTDAGRPTNNWR